MTIAKLTTNEVPAKYIQTIKLQHSYNIQC